ncbi:splicing factor U2af large subunit B isoform X2 [Tanacetum coccineum]
MDYQEERYEGNGQDVETLTAAAAGANNHGGDELSDSKSQRASRDSERESSKSRSKDRERVRDKDRDKDRDRERERDRDRNREKSRDRDREKSRDPDREKSRDRERDRDRDRHRDRRERSDRRDRDRDDDDYHRSRDYDRRRDYDRDREDRRSRHRSRSRSRAKSERRSRSRSRSRSKSKRVSGFDMAPPASAMLAGAAAVTPVANGASDNLFVKARALATLPTSGEMTTKSSTEMVLLAVGIPMFSALDVSAFGGDRSSGECGWVGRLDSLSLAATRHARRIYFGELSPTANEQSVATYFSHVMSAIGGNTAGPGDAVVNVYINHEKKFAFVEMRSVEEASNAMALDGIIFEGAPVKVRRPSDYNPSLAATLGPSQPNPNLNLGAVGLTPGSAGGLEGPDRIFVGGLPYYFTEAQVRELLESFGALRGFDLVKDRETGNSKGYAFCVYQDLSVTDIACAALNGIKMGDKTLTVRRANQGQTQPKPEQESVLLHAQQQIALQRLMLQPGPIGPPPTKVLSLTQVVTEEELVNDEDYEDILEDMKIECGKFGNLVNVVIPRPNPNGEPVAGVGKVFLEYDNTDGSTRARQGLNGRKFGGNQVVASFYPEDKFSEGVYDG